MAENPAYAETWLAGVQEKILGLEAFPESHAVAPESDAFDCEIRQLLYGRGTPLAHLLHHRRLDRPRSSRPARQQGLLASSAGSLRAGAPGRWLTSSRRIQARPPDRRRGPCRCRAAPGSGRGTRTGGTAAVAREGAHRLAPRVRDAGVGVDRRQLAPLAVLHALELHRADADAPASRPPRTAHHRSRRNWARNRRMDVGAGMRVFRSSSELRPMASTG